MDNTSNMDSKVSFKFGIDFGYGKKAKQVTGLLRGFLKRYHVDLILFLFRNINISSVTFLMLFLWDHFKTGLLAYITPLFKRAEKCISS